MSEDAGAVAPRRRDADGTRRLLLAAGRRRFASDGYAATTVRHIADDAGVNVALISRYFTSKEGLFEACLTGAADELERSVEQDLTLEELAGRMVRQITGPDPVDRPTQLLLLMRTSGDEHAELIRLRTLRTFAERLAAIAGSRPDDPDRERMLLRAQLVVAAGFGISIMRSWTQASAGSGAMEPLTSAGEAELAGPVHDLLIALLGGL
ncbi:TetR/AcrR family transcriptional regulator [Cellulomonas sp. URHD0024]|uniref:TetR/AcrR family transcriptional regulator n=1 Tax=Cellulomonas sp. URHD0024 TaxID=1302620 RepID=UPI0004893648|nr:TetR/AcrR family transcriptional regulator [Cellulomonas sp. URHD0024]